MEHCADACKDADEGIHARNVEMRILYYFSLVTCLKRHPCDVLIEAARDVLKEAAS